MDGHTHSASNITSGTLSAARGGTGVTSIDALKSALGLGSGSVGTIVTGAYTGKSATNNTRASDADAYKFSFPVKPKIFFIYSVTEYNNHAFYMCVLFPQMITNMWGMGIGQWIEPGDPNNYGSSCKFYCYNTTERVKDISGVYNGCIFSDYQWINAAGINYEYLAIL